MGAVLSRCAQQSTTYSIYTFLVRPRPKNRLGNVLFPDIKRRRGGGEGGESHHINTSNFPFPPPKGEGKGLQAKGLKKAKNTATSGLIGYLLRSFSSEIRALELCTPEYLPHTVQVYIV